MFEKLRRARADPATMLALFPKAEQIARADGVDEPGAEHLLLAALDLDDGIATRALDRFHVDAGSLRAAIGAQHDEALRAIGVIADASLHSGHILLAVTEPEQCTVARSLEHLGLDRRLLRELTATIATSPRSIV